MAASYQTSQLIQMQAAQTTVQGKSKRLPQGRKYLNALKKQNQWH